MEVSTQNHATTGTKDILEKCRNYGRVVAGRFMRPSDVQAAGLYVYFEVFEDRQGCAPGEVRIQGRKILIFGSNDYLDLTTYPKVKEAALQALCRYGTSCSGARILNGTLDLHIRLESELAALTRKEDALIFGTGFQTNHAVLSTLAGDSGLTRVYPLVLITGSRFMPMYHSEQRQLAAARLGKHDPSVALHPDTAAALGLEEATWVLVITPQGKTRQRVRITAAVDPRMADVQHGWWFPERPGEDPALFDVFESNANVLCPDAPEFCNPEIGSWPHTALLCRVKKESPSLAGSVHRRG